MSRRSTVFLVLLLLSSLPLPAHAAEKPGPAKRKPSAAEVFDHTQAVLLADDFRANTFGKWRLSLDGDYDLTAPPPGRIAIVDAPGLDTGHKAARFVVPRAANSYRSEIALPHEQGCRERWYGARILAPSDWVIDPGKGGTIVLQWHGIPGNWRATFPNLQISIDGAQWRIRRNFGAAQAGPTREDIIVDDPLRPGKWVAWVIHARWSTKEDGLLRVWKDGKLVAEKGGPNIYTTIGVEYTPYLKTGLYHPNWNLRSEGRQAAFARESPVTEKSIYVTDLKIGSEKARYEDIAPAPLP